jgi:hypothetical protein
MENQDTAWHKQRKYIVPILVGIILAILLTVVQMNWMWMAFCWLVVVVCVAWLIIVVFVSQTGLRNVVLAVVVVLLIIWGGYQVRNQWVKDYPKPAPAAQNPTANEPAKPAPLPVKPPEPSKEPPKPAPGTEKPAPVPHKPSRNKAQQKQLTPDSVNIDEFDSKVRIVFYNPGGSEVFVSHLKLDSKDLGYSGVIFINKTIEGKQRLVFDLRAPTTDLSKWVVGSISENSWQQLLHSLHLNENECVQWHFFVPNDPGYQTVKNFLGSGFHEVPIDGTLYFHSGQDDRQNNLAVRVFAVPYINQACMGPNRTFRFQ